MTQNETQPRLKKKKPCCNKITDRRVNLNQFSVPVLVCYLMSRRDKIRKKISCRGKERYLFLEIYLLY